MAMFYYYIDFDYVGKEIKKGPYTLDELRALNLPVDTKIWSDGWEENKPISDCPEVMEYFSITLPEIPAIPEEVPAVAVETETDVIAIHPDMHWLPSILMVFGIIGTIGQTIINCADMEDTADLVLLLVTSAWGIASLVGMLAKKKWALISYFAYRLCMLLLFALLVKIGLSNGDVIAKDIIKFLMIIGIFFISKDGHNVYELLWNNGVFYVKREKPVEEPTEQSEGTNIEATE